MSAIAGATRVCALIGAPVAHSLSPAMHNAAYSHLGLDLVYVALHVEPAGLSAAIAGAAALGFVGLNVTAPHKEAALACCDPDDDAKAVGAVNTIVFSAAGARGTNTDLVGLERAIEVACPRGVRRALVLGAGGAARAAISVLDGAGAEVSIAARSARRVEVRGISHEVHALASLTPSLLGELDLVIDATPAGLNDGGPLIDVALLPGDAAVLDLSVRSSTPLTRAARAQGLRTELGHEMLLHQGAAGFLLFTGQPAPITEMRAALDRAREAA